MNQATRSPSTQASSALRREREGTPASERCIANRLAAAVAACVHASRTCLFCLHCVSRKTENLLFFFQKNPHTAGLRSKGLYKSFVLSHPLIVRLHPYGASLWRKSGSHDSMSAPLVRYMCGYAACRTSQHFKAVIIGVEDVKTVFCCCLKTGHFCSSQSRLIYSVIFFWGVAATDAQVGRVHQNMCPSL